jgi:hypothetical protein
MVTSVGSVYGPQLGCACRRPASSDHAVSTYELNGTSRRSRATNVSFRLLAGYGRDTPFNVSRACEVSGMVASCFRCA